MKKLGLGPSLTLKLRLKSLLSKKPGPPQVKREYIRTRIHFPTTPLVELKENNWLVLRFRVAREYAYFHTKNPNLGTFLRAL
jgi:hypothetical protein